MNEFILQASLFFFSSSNGMFFSDPKQQHGCCRLYWPNHCHRYKAQFSAMRDYALPEMILSLFDEKRMYMNGCDNWRSSLKEPQFSNGIFYCSHNIASYSMVWQESVFVVLICNTDIIWVEIPFVIQKSMTNHIFPNARVTSNKMIY